MLEQIEPAAHETKQSGFALILAILALLLLTFLGLAMALTTSTELQVARNYELSKRALYNAEAGIEAAKSILRTADWPSILWQQRTASWDGVNGALVQGGGIAPAPPGRNDQWGNATRNFASWQCDNRGNGVGYGVVLDLGAGDPNSPFQYITNINIGGTVTPLNGAVTVWVRRLVQSQADGRLIDFKDTNDDTLIVTAEGIAPFTGGSATTAFAQGRQAVELMEVTLTKINVDNCLGRGGQTGGDQFGSGNGGCTRLNNTQNLGNGNVTRLP